MVAKLENWSLKISDYLLIAWGFLLAIMLINQSSSFILELFGNTSLSSLLAAINTQLCFLAYAIIVNIYFKLGLFEPKLGFRDLLKKGFKYFLIGLSLVFGTNLTINIIAKLFDYSFDLQAAIELWQNLNGFLEISLGFLVTVILAPIAEELIFRGLLYRLFRSKMPVYLAIITSSAIFALIHFSIFAFLALFFLSCLLCYIYEKYCDLKLCMLVHCLFNFFNTILILLCQSGQNL
ncbi:MAG: type II CAAX endopeptidase family protein [Opitutales bacterium]